MDEVKWAWVLFVAATLALLVRIAMWFLPAPGWRSAKVAAAEEAPAAASRTAAEEAPAVLGVPAEPRPAPPIAEPPAAEDSVEEALRRFREEPAPAAAAPAPAEVFHLRRARWGMTPAEVRAAEPGEPLRASDRALLYATTTLEMPCLLTYGFADGRLVRARLAFSDPAGRDIPPLTMAQAQRRYLYLREQLRSRYGEGVEKTTTMPRDVSELRRRMEKQDELARQYDAEIAEAERRLKEDRARLAKRFARWADPAKRVAQALAPHERDLKDLQEWKREALETAARSRQDLRKTQEADAARPLVATMATRWAFAREMHDIELILDARTAPPLLEIRYEGAPSLPAWLGNEL